MGCGRAERGNPAWAARRTDCVFAAPARATITIPVGTGSRALAVAPDGKWVHVVNPCCGNSSVSLIDTTTNGVAAPILVDQGATDIALTSDGNWAYVVSGSNVSVIYTPLRTVTKTISVYQPYGVAIAPNGSAYVAGGAGVSVIDTTLNSVTTTITPDFSPRPGGLGRIAIAPNGTAYVLASSSGVGTSSGVWVIDTTRNVSKGLIPIGGSNLWGVAVTPDGNRVYATNSCLMGDPTCDPAGQGLTRIDTTTNEVVATIPVGGRAVAIGSGANPTATTTPTEPPTPTATMATGNANSDEHCNGAPNEHASSDPDQHPNQYTDQYGNADTDEDADEHVHSYDHSHPQTNEHADAPVCRRLQRQRSGVGR